GSRRGPTGARDPPPPRAGPCRRRLHPPLPGGARRAALLILPDQAAVRQMLKCGRAMHVLLAAVSRIPPGAPPGRYWLEGLSALVPSPSASRALLLADVAVILLAA